ncbi:uncharacterized protein LOC130630469 [Hydractinia symbiolongicarpus]|uniref:uncharacterized protein LOC130630469 n=1 Tax=Hydractinia symbiolongicarpus TaxID=13093 RepID=UPI00254F3ECE|nr:uncharacterized protein LOC130630469 [Hydractinia symbiolongicarpus]
MLPEMPKESIAERRRRKAAKRVYKLSIALLLLGILAFAFTGSTFATGFGFTPFNINTLWSSLWYIVTSILGMRAGHNPSRRCLVKTFNGFAVTASIFAFCGFGASGAGIAFHFVCGFFFWVGFGCSYLVFAYGFLLVINFIGMSILIILAVNGFKIYNCCGKPSGDPVYYEANETVPHQVTEESYVYQPQEEKVFVTSKSSENDPSTSFSEELVDNQGYETVSHQSTEEHVYQPQEGQMLVTSQSGEQFILLPVSRQGQPPITPIKTNVSYQSLSLNASTKAPKSQKARSPNVPIKAPVSQQDRSIKALTEAIKLHHGRPSKAPIRASISHLDRPSNAPIKTRTSHHGRTLNAPIKNHGQTSNAPMKTHTSHYDRTSYAPIKDHGRTSNASIKTHTSHQVRSSNGPFIKPVSHQGRSSNAPIKTHKSHKVRTSNASRRAPVSHQDRSYVSGRVTSTQNPYKDLIYNYRPHAYEY